MLTYILMGLLVLGLVVTTLWGLKYQPDKDCFMSIEDTTFLRGFWCIIVVLVHVPELYQNRIQDMLGSFAYIGVTFFFMTSAYGLKWSLEHRPGYMDHFWRRRLPSILIPALIANLLNCFVQLAKGKEITFFSIVNVNPWVKVLLINYIVFWIIYYLIPSKIGGGIWQEITICIIAIGWSLTERLTGYLAMSWEVERLGFVYGILLAANYKRVNEWIHKKWLVKSIALMMASGVIGISYLKFKPVEFYGDYLLKIILGIVLTVFVIEITSGFKVGNRANRLLGAVSYEVYLLHEIVFLAIILLIPGLHSGVFIVGSIVITVILGIVLKKLSDSIMEILIKQ